LAKDFFNERGVKYTEYDVLADIDKRREMMERSGQLGVPVIMIGDEIIIGFDEPRISELLGV